MKKDCCILKDWSVCTPDDPYLAPEHMKIYLQGLVYGHPKHEDGKHIVTSSIKDIESRYVTTHSGTKYLLGKIDPKYRTWLRKNRPDWDWKNPIVKIKGE